jgi:hypothetical protein
LFAACRTVSHSRLAATIILSLIRQQWTAFVNWISADMGCIQVGMAHVSTKGDFVVAVLSRHCHLTEGLRMRRAAQDI